MELTRENYFSKQADLEYMSVSQWKLFNECEAKALATVYGDIDATQKEAFLEGHLFEELVAGDAKLFISQHPEMISSRGATAGELKSEFKKVLVAAERFNDQKFFKDIINRCDKQVILTGVINGVKTKCCLDLFDKQRIDIYDIKYMKDYKELWNKDLRVYEPWYYAYGYVMQLAVYKEIVEQNFKQPVNELGLISATKEEVPDLSADKFSRLLLDMELDEFKNKIVRFNDVKLRKIEPTYCGHCDYCKKIKQITEFKEVN